MRKIIFLLLSAIYFSGFTQVKIPIAKGDISVILFPSEISNYKLGNKLEFIAEKDINNSINIRIIEDTSPKRGTNLVVFTKDGSVYQVNLELKSIVENNIHSLTLKNATVKGNLLTVAQPTIPINAEKPATASNGSLNSNQSTVENELKDIDPDVLEACKKSNKRKKRIFQILKKEYSMILSLRDVAYFKDQIFLFIDLKNKGGQAYDVKQVTYLLSTSTNGIFKGSQKKGLTPYYIHKEPKRIEGRTTHQFIVVLNKTSINEQRAITIRVDELGGERNLNLDIKDQIINNPKAL